MRRAWRPAVRQARLRHNQYGGTCHGHCCSPRNPDGRVRRRRRRVSAPRRQAVAGDRLQAERRGPVPGHGRMPRRRLVHERPPHREAAPPVHGLARRRVDRARLPLRQRGSVSGLRAGHQLRGALGQGQRTRAQDPARSHRPVGPVERRPPRHAGRHAAARSALCGDPAARRLTRPGRQRALRDHVLAGHQPAQPLPPRQARRGQRQSAGLAEVDHRPPRFLLAIGSQHVRGQPDDGARAR